MATVLETQAEHKSLAELADEMFPVHEAPDLERITRPEREAFRAAVAQVAAHAKARLPECTGRVDSAVKLVLAGDVELLPDGTAHVLSATETGTAYHVVNGSCYCKDFPHAPHGFCKHRLGRAIAIRARELAHDTHAEPVEPTADAPADIPAQFIVSLHGKQFVLYSGLLSLAHQRGLISLSAKFISVTADCALAEATATFADGKQFTEAADASPSNVGATIKQHYARMALTRAKARCLRDALNIGLCSLEEID